MFSEKSKNFIKALAIFSGTIVGVGLFGLPYVAFKSGFLIVLGYFLVLTAFTIVFHRLLGEIALGTENAKRIPGYVEEYLGKKAKKFSLINSSLGITGALLAYLIVGGGFLKLFFSPYFGGNEIFYVLLFFAAGAFLIYKGTKTIARVELAMLFVFVAISLFLFIKGIPFINLDNLKGVSWNYFVLPYGVIMFSLWGLTMVPELKEIVLNDRKELMKVITWGILLSAVFYLVFIITILGASGSLTSEEALTGFSKAIGNKIVQIGFIFGFLTTFTSFITLGLTLKKTFFYDAKIPEKISWCLACFIPLVLYFANLKDFIGIIGIVGAFMLGIEGILVIFVYRNFVRIKLNKMPSGYTYLLLGVFAAGIIFELWHLLK